MNMLCDEVPQSLNICGTEYEINTDFRVWIRFEKLLSDDNKTASEIFSEVKNLVFKSTIPPAKYDEETTNQLLWFYHCGKQQPKGTSSGAKEVFSYDFDDGYICAAFMQQYHIQINRVSLHWWEFHSLMLSLSDSTEFVKIMGYRAVEINSKMTTEQRSFYQKMKKHYRLPIKEELREKCNAIEEALLKGESIDNLI